jgi:hypothetical protein
MRFAPSVLVADASSLLDVQIRRRRVGDCVAERLAEVGIAHWPHVVVLAEALGLPILTTDARLARSHGHTAEIIAFPG